MHPSYVILAYCDESLSDEDWKIVCVYGQSTEN